LAARQQFVQEAFENPKPLASRERACSFADFFIAAGRDHDAAALRVDPN